jgi:sodium/bile acid cotransporter 7
MKVKLDWFLLGMALATSLAWLVPDPGASGGSLHPELLNKLAVALIFFLHGLALSFAALRHGAGLWRLHLLVQLATFLLCPLLGLLAHELARGRLDPALALGLFYLGALPSTVSSSIAMTALARGNVPAAVFNASLSSILGVVLTPLWLGAVLAGGQRSLSLGSVMLDLCRWLLLPLALGQLMRPLLGAWAARHKARIGIVDRLTILLLVYTSFCDSFKAGVWGRTGLGSLFTTLAFSGFMLGSVMFIVRLGARRLHFPREDAIAAMFCGSKKTLASGVPMARLIFGAHPALALILLPIMIYHPLQLIVCGWLAGRWADARPLPPAGTLAGAAGK